MLTARLLSKLPASVLFYRQNGFGAVSNPQVISTANQDNPLISAVLGFEDKMVPIIGVDVWEHAYYLRYGPKRPSYLSSLDMWPDTWACSSIGSSNIRG